MTNKLIQTGDCCKHHLGKLGQKKIQMKPSSLETNFKKKEKRKRNNNNNNKKEIHIYNYHTTAVNQIHLHWSITSSPIAASTVGSIAQQTL